MLLARGGKCIIDELFFRSNTVCAMNSWWQGTDVYGTRQPWYVGRGVLRPGTGWSPKISIGIGELKIGTALF